MRDAVLAICISTVFVFALVTSCSVSDRLKRLELQTSGQAEDLKITRERVRSLEAELDHVAPHTIPVQR